MGNTYYNKRMVYNCIINFKKFGAKNYQMKRKPGYKSRFMTFHFYLIIFWSVYSRYTDESVLKYNNVFDNALILFLVKFQYYLFLNIF